MKVRKRITFICMLVLSVLCFSFFAVSCSNGAVPEHTISYSVENQGHGSVMGTCNSGSKVKLGGAVTLTATANNGYTFDGWYEGEEQVSNQSTYNFTVSKDVNLVAKFKALKYTLEFGCQSEHGHIECVIETGAKVDYNENVTLIAYPKEGYTFDKWYIRGTDEVVCETATFSFTMPNNDYDVEARFTVNSYALNIVFDQTKCEIVIEGEDGTVYQNGDNIKYNTELILTVTEKEGYKFVEIVEGETPISNTKAYSFNMPAKEYNLSIETEKEKRTVQFISQSVIIKTVEVYYGTCVERYEPTKENYEFVDWFVDAELSSLFDFETKITKDTSIYASWNETNKSYLVEFVDWNGKRIDTIQTISEGGSATVPATPERTGYEFDKWVCDGDYLNVDRNLVVTATYTIKKYTVVFYKDSQKLQPYETQQVEHGSFAKFPPSITEIDGGLLFDKWTYEDQTEFNFETPIVSDLVLIATYKQSTKTVFEVKFMAYGQLIDTQYVEEGDFVNEPNVVALEGEKLSGWDKEITKAITSNTTFTAQFETITFKVTFVDYDQTVISEQTVNYNTSATNPGEQTREGYTFSGWDKEFETILEDLTITAQYTIIKLVATYYDGDKYLGEITADYGTAFAVLATPIKDGFSFDWWYLDSEFKNKYDFKSEAVTDITLYAKYDEIELELYTVKFYVDDEIYSEQNVYSGKDAVAPGIPSKVGHTFSHWNGTFANVTSNVNVYAIFTINTYMVKFYEQDGTRLIASVTAEYGSQAEQPTPPTVTGHYFTKWSEDVSFITEDIEVYAIYEKNVVEVCFKDSDDDSVIATSFVKYGGKVSIIKTPSKMGSIFAGWYLDKNCTTAFNFDTIIEDATILYAKWEPVFNAYTVHFYVNNELYGKVQKVAYEKCATEPAPPQGFTVWRDKATDEIFDFTTPITKNTELYASN